MDRQRRANNPQNYNANGTVKKGKKTWKKSNRYKKTSSKAAQVDRKLAAHRKSVQVRSPSMFMSSLKRKAENAGGRFNDFPTQRTKLSQVCHICGNTVKKPLSQRWHTCCGIKMQRDLYSAFLNKCVDVNTNSLDIARAKQLWPGLEPVLSAAVSRAYQSANGGKTVPASFGFGQRQRGYMNSGISRL